MRRALSFGSLLPSTAARYGSSGEVPRLWTYSRDYDSFSSQKACYMCVFYVCSSDLDFLFAWFSTNGGKRW